MSVPVHGDVGADEPGHLTRRTVLQRGAVMAATMPALPALLAGRAAAASSVRQKTLVFNLDAQISGGLDATQSFDTTTKQIAFRLSEPLVQFDFVNLKSLPGLATRWKIAPD